MAEKRIILVVTKKTMGVAMFKVTYDVGTDGVTGLPTTDVYVGRKNDILTVDAEGTVTQQTQDIHASFHNSGEVHIKDNRTGKVIFEEVGGTGGMQALPNPIHFFRSPIETMNYAIARGQLPVTKANQIVLEYNADAELIPIFCVEATFIPPISTDASTTVDDIPQGKSFLVRAVNPWLEIRVCRNPQC